MAKKIRKIRLGLTGFMAIMGLFMVIYFNFMEKPVDGSKEIVIKVVNQENNVTTYEVKTDGKVLTVAKAIIVSAKLVWIRANTVNHLLFEGVMLPHIFNCYLNSAVCRKMFY